MSRKHAFQFLDLPAPCRSASGGTAHVRRLGELYGKFGKEDAQYQAGRCRTAATRTAAGSARCTTPFRSGCSWCRRTASTKPPRCATAPTRCRRCAAGSARRIALCEGSCTLEEFGAVTIGAVEKYIVDTALASGWRPDLGAVAADRPQRCGDRGRSAAWRAPTAWPAPALPRWSTTATSRSAACCSSAFPASSWTRDVIHRRRDVLEGMGVQFRLGVEIGRDLSVQQLLDTTMRCSSVPAPTATPMVASTART